jgi:hypothetical protein
MTCLQNSNWRDEAAIISGACNTWRILELSVDKQCDFFRLCWKHTAWTMPEGRIGKLDSDVIQKLEPFKFVLTAHSNYTHITVATFCSGMVSHQAALPRTHFRNGNCTACIPNI